MSLRSRTWEIVETVKPDDRVSRQFDTVWWAIATLTTVGYGDIYPITFMGRLFAGLTALLGVGLVALPAGILGSGFAEAIQQTKASKIAPTCPHCGKELS